MKCNITPIDVCQCDSDEQCKAKIEIDRLTAQLADRDTELKRQTEIVEDAEQSYFRIVDKYNSRADQILQLQTENATLREEVERLKVCLFQMQEAAKDTRKQVAREVEKHLLGMHWTIPYHETEAMIYRDQAIEWLRDKFGLEG